MSEVDHPDHYQSKNRAYGLEVIKVIEAYALGFNLGNVVKYVLRCENKGKPIEDLEKAKWYLSKEIERRKYEQGEVDSRGSEK